MPVKCQTVIEAMDTLAPRYLAESWDNIGLLVGSPEQDIASIMVVLDATPETVAEAQREGVDMMIAHHPLIFTPLTSIRTDLPPGATLARLLKNDIALFAAHTNLDAVAGGVSDALANRLELGNLRPLTQGSGAQLLKLAVFVPESHLEKVRLAVTEAGAGNIGNYSHCTFQTAGTGTFLPLAGAKPFIGSQGRLEYAAEFRLETVLPAAISRKVVTAMIKAHPYEEVAYDLFALSNTVNVHGLGRLGELPAPLSVEGLVKTVKTALKVDCVRVAGSQFRQVQTVAVCGGAGGSLVRAAAAAGAEVLVTGDVKYHEAQEAQELGLTVIDAGHFATEFPVTDVILAYLEDCAHKGGWSVQIKTGTLNKDIFYAV